MEEMNNLANNSGQGSGSPVLDIVKKRFNWGAFFLNWIWGLGNKTFITLIIFPLSMIGMIPILGLALIAVPIWFGIKGNEWAWQNKRWDSIEAFHATQKKWAIAGVIVWILSMVTTVAIILLMTLPVLMMDTSSVANKTMIKKEITSLSMAIELNEAMETKCKLSADGLAACIAERTNAVDYNGGNVLNMMDGSVWTFSNKDVTIDVNGAKEPNIDGEDIVTVPFYLKKSGYITIKEKDYNKYLEK